MLLYHYFDKTIGPFVNLSDISIDNAKAVLDRITMGNTDQKDMWRLIYGAMKRLINTNN